jgi:N-acetylglucosamine kinase-like BadF-type ATPase
MILVADSGSTKTDWMVELDNEIRTFSTNGINPYFTNTQDILKIINKNKELIAFASEVNEVYFFGAGCLNIDKREIVSNGLSLVFKNAFVSVDHDLMGSAYATCGDKKGFACILGTGSNIAYFDGDEVYSGKHGLGYVLGDEGSGTYFGKKLVCAYLYESMPAELAHSFYEDYPIDKDVVIHRVYQEAFPNTYLAAFSKFMFKHRQHPYIQQLLRSGFQEFIDTNIKDYKNYKIIESNFVGSIAYHFQDELRAVFEENELKLGKVVQKPIDSIYEFIVKREKMKR